MIEEKIRVLVKRVGRPAEWKTIPNTLEALQHIVGGYIETVTVTRDLIIICNEEGMLRGLPKNVTLLGWPFMGDILLVSQEGERFAGLRITEIELVNLLPELFQKEISEKENEK